jgi:general nucleoside transport system permease protein
MTLPVRLRLEPALVRRSALDAAVRIAIGAVIALVLGGVVLVASGHDVAGAYQALFRGAFGTERAWGATLNKAVPIGLSAIGIALAARAGLWNIGAEGQFYMGAFAATGIGLALPVEVPAVVAIPAVITGGIVAGALWAAIAGAAKAFLAVNEIIGTLLLNYVAILWVNYLVFGPWADPATFSFPFSEPLPDGALLPDLAANIHTGVLFLIAAIGLFWAVDRGTRWGYELRVRGDAPGAAIYGGIRDWRVVVSALAAAGALAGLAGVIEVSAVTSRLQEGLSPGYGFIGILVAWIAANRPIPILIASILYAGFLNGAFSLQVSGTPAAIGTVLQSLLLLCVLGLQSLSGYRLRVLRRAPG